VRARESRERVGSLRGVRSQRHSRLAERCARVRRVVHALVGLRELPSSNGPESGDLPGDPGRMAAPLAERPMIWRPVAAASGEWIVTRCEGFLTMFNLMGPHASVAALRELFPEVPRAILEETLRRARRSSGAGTAGSSTPCAGPGRAPGGRSTSPSLPCRGRSVLSGCCWCGTWRAASSCSRYRAGGGIGGRALGPAAPVRPARSAAGAQIDNGSAFTSREVQARLHLSGGSPCSPRHGHRSTTQHRGGIGSLEVRGLLRVGRHDRPGQWTSDDSPPPRARRTETTRPASLHGSTPEHTWHLRVPLDSSEREAFESAL
jgi:hypothetical protein